MGGLFGSSPFVDSQLGELRRSRRLWRGSLSLAEVSVPLALSGTRTEPDSAAIDLARTIPASFPSWRPVIERALFEHYEPYADADEEVPGIADPAGVWPHVQPRFVSVTPLDGQPVVEIGYDVAWDEEHTLGARLRDGQLLELSGSVLAP